jgi:arylsulfatase A-like enzyme
MRLFLLLCLALTAPVFASPPNVIVILTDDLGVNDLGYTGSKFYETPHIDQLAKDGVQFTQAYSSSTVCSPTRAALLTGKYPARLHLTDWIHGHPAPSNAKVKIPNWQKFISSDTTTLPQQFKSAGYSTALIGKWHLTPNTKTSENLDEYSPLKYGFDINIGGNHLGQPGSFFSPYKIPNLKDGPTNEFLTDRESDEAVKFIELNQTKPFFLYLAHYAVHQPIAGKPDVIKKFEQKNNSNIKKHNATYAALISSVDDSLGKIRETLKRLKLSDNTIIVFTSDNGGLPQVTDNSPYRDGKGSAYEGGVRVPFIIYWPKASANQSTEPTPIQSIDIYPSLVEMTGITSQTSTIDGVSLVPLLKSSAALPVRDLFWHYPHYHRSGGARPYSAIRSGDYRLIHFYEDNRDELYNLAKDPSESQDLSNTEIEIKDKLKKKLEAWLQSTSAQLPVR